MFSWVNWAVRWSGVTSSISGHFLMNIDRFFNYCSIDSPLTDEALNPFRNRTREHSTLSIIAQIVLSPSIKHLNVYITEIHSLRLAWAVWNTNPSVQQQTQLTSQTQFFTFQHRGLLWDFKSNINTCIWKSNIIACSIWALREFRWSLKEALNRLNNEVSKHINPCFIWHSCLVFLRSSWHECYLEKTEWW